MNLDQNQKKWVISLVLGVAFLLVSSPYLYKFVEYLASMVGVKIANNGCPTTLGIIVHSVVFFLLVRLSMNLIVFSV